MGGGKSQKGGNHGFIGRTLAHDILARQAKQSEMMRGDRQYRQPEYSVVERSSLEEFTLAAEMGLTSYLNTHGGTREVLASDFNSQLARMVNYSEADEYEVFPVVPIPRRCLFFGDEQREAIGKLIKQREHMQHVKDKRRNKRRNKKLVDMYMHGTGPRPVNGVFEPRRMQLIANQTAQDMGQDYDSDDEFDISDDFNGGRTIINGDESDGRSEEKSQIPEVVACENSFFNTDGIQGCFKFNPEATTQGEAQVTVLTGKFDSTDIGGKMYHDKNDTVGKVSVKYVGRHGDNYHHLGRENLTDNDSDFETEEVVEDDSGFETEDGDSGFETDDNDSDFETEEVVEDDSGFETEDGDSGYETDEDVNELITEGPKQTKLVFLKKTVDTSYSKSDKDLNLKHNEGDIKYVKEYKKAIEQEVLNVDICKIDANELNRIETKCFYTWRRLLSRIEDEEARVVTPYEKNIEFWRQLWRVIERSHLLLIIVDARDPLFYRVPDLEDYVKEVDGRKEAMLVLNKADHLSIELRKAWAEHFKMKGVDFVFFSTIWGKSDASYSNPELLEDMSSRVFNVEMLLNKINEYRQKQMAIFPELGGHVNTDMPVYTVGFVGYPNVGKSSLINCLMEATKTNVSCQPGKTKHLQTLPLKQQNITLCDCPGLIFPNIVANKHHLLVNSIVSTAHFRGSLIFAVQLICNRIPKQCCERYDVDRAECITINKYNKPILLSTKFLECICNSRKFYSGGKGGQPDLGRAAKLVVKDYVNGNLLYCAWPPQCKPRVSQADQEHIQDVAEYLAKLNLGKERNSIPGNDMKVPREVQVEESKMEQWLMTTSSDIVPPKPQVITKRKMRFLLKGKRKENTKHNYGAYL
ncbi:GTPase subfamily protein [Babesia ovis]|uniref:GTPase subfamily protein n=1 Tax=Babesia ovis TaxID=5869 RepID=A0A9W5TAE5_BABOV|nr:GTPase subfamily protein [Babesia ovis]